MPTDTETLKSEEKSVSKKKLLIAITKSNFGGAQRYVFDLAKALKTEFDLTVVSGGEGVLKEKLEQESISIKKISSLGRDIAIIGDIKSFFSLITILQSVRPDILHLNSSKIGILGAIAGRLTGTKKIIFTAHAWPFNENRKRISRLIFRFLGWTTVLLCHKTIAVSNAIMHDVEKMPFVKNKIVVIHNGIDTSTLLSKSEARARIGEINSDVLLVGTVAELHPTKGLRYAIDAFVPLKNSPIRYAIIGDGEERQSLDTHIKNLGLENQISLKGFIRDAAQIMPALDIFLLPSLSEGLAYVLLEAGHAGTAVIASNVGGITEVIDDMQSGIVIKARRPRQITEALNYYIKHPEKRKEFSEKLQRNVQQNFTLHQMVKKTSEIYNRL